MRTLSIVLVLGLAACGPSITGKVTDRAGNPQPGTIVNLQTTRHQVSADEDGSFKLPGEQGVYTIAVAQTGFVTEEVEVDLSDGESKDVGTIELIKVPDSKGFKIFVAPDFVDMQQGRAYRSMWGANYYPEGKDTCVDKIFSKANETQAGDGLLFDNDAHDWRIWKLDEWGCAERLVKDIETGRWSEEWAEQAKPTVRELSTEQSVIKMDIPAGEYFIAEWFNGGFVKDKGEKYVGPVPTNEHYEKTDPGEEWSVYKGYWLVVK